MEMYLGTILLMALSKDRLPREFLPCDGRSLQVRDNQALYSLLLNRFGGDTMNYFNLPKLDAPAPNLVYVICVEGLYPSPA